MEDKTRCPECGESALVEWRFVLESTDGPIEHCKVGCGHGHWFLLPVSMLSRRVAASGADLRAREFAEPEDHCTPLRGRD